MLLLLYQGDYVVVQAVEEEGEDATSDEFGGGVLRKRQKASRLEQQSDGEAADLQQVTFTALSVFKGYDLTG